MVLDSVKFLALLMWIIFAFACFFLTLFREPYGGLDPMKSDQPWMEECIDPDTEFENLLDGIIYLWHATLLGEGACIRGSSPF